MYINTKFSWLLFRSHEQSSELRSAFGIADLNADYEEVEDSFSYRPEHSKTTNFVGNETLIKKKNDSIVLNLFHLDFVLIFFVINFI